MSTPNKKQYNKGFRFAIDRGGTFTDVFAQWWNSNHQRFEMKTLKLLSQSSEYEDSCIEAIKRVITETRGKVWETDEKIDPCIIESVRMGTTVATNALLERSGQRLALIVTRGFADILKIGDQSRPSIFDLRVVRFKGICDAVVEVDERVQLLDRENISEVSLATAAKATYETGVTGQRVCVLKKLDEKQVSDVLKGLREQGFRSLAVSLLHSYTYREHELLVATIARQLGFIDVFLSHESSPVNKHLARTYTACVDAYLTPIIKSYARTFLSGFTRPPSIAFMQSDGGLVPADVFSGVRAVFSGPAGGYVGAARTAFIACGGVPVIGFDMGGTSTDVSRYDGTFDVTNDSCVSGVTLHVPQLDIRTIAAGGGSILSIKSGMLYVGPDSAGALPGPACYRNMGPVTLTDANVVLGRLPGMLFPRVFGPDQNQELHEAASVTGMERLTSVLNAFNVSRNLPMLTPEEVALGFVQVANEGTSICSGFLPISFHPSSIPSISDVLENYLLYISYWNQGKGFEASSHVLACFGGAGGLHACSMARQLGIKKVFVHKFAGILSAVGLALSDIQLG